MAAKAKVVLTDYVWNTGIEPGVNEGPVDSRTERLRERKHVIVRVGVAEGRTHGMKQVLAVDEYGGPLDRGLSGHEALQKITPPEAFRRVQRGGSNDNVQRPEDPCQARVSRRLKCYRAKIVAPFAM